MMKLHFYLIIITSLFVGLTQTSAQAALDILSPTGTEKVKFGTTLNIRWLNGDVGTNDRFNIQYSDDGGNFVTIASPWIYQLANSGDTSTYAWNVPDFGSDSVNDVNIRVVNTTNAVEDVSAPFKVYFEPSVEILVPTGTETLKFSENINIRWLNRDIGTNDRFNIQYSDDGGNFVTIASPWIYQLTNSGDTSTYTWSVPDFGADSTNDINIRVVNSTRSVSDTSELFKVYYEPSVDILMPEGTESLKFGASIDIRWTNGDIGTNDRFNIQYSIGGGNFVTIASPWIYQLANSEDTSTYTWTIPDFGSNVDDQLVIKVRNTTRAVEDASNEFRVFYEPGVVIFEPDSTVKVKFGETIKISWFNGDIGTNDRFNIQYSDDGGNYVTIASPWIYQLTNQGDSSTYNWAVPDFGADSLNEIKVRVQNTTRAVMDTSEAFLVYYEPKVEMQSPMATDSVKFGETISISWVNADIGTNDRFSISYSKDGGSYNTVASPWIYQLARNGDTATYNWAVPDFGADASNAISVRVQNTTRAVADTSETFTVYYEPKVTALTPAPEEFLLQGSTKRISWINGDVGTNDRFNLSYSTDGTNYISITSPWIYQLTNQGDTSSYNWTVPSIESSTVSVRIVNNNRAVADTTAQFTICTTCPAVSIISPNGGEVLGIGKTVNISWNVGTTWQATDNITVEYSLDGGSSFETTPIFDGAYSDITDNTIQWDINAVASEQALIRVTNTTQTVSDVSDAVFAIVTSPAVPVNFEARENANQTVTLSWTDNATNEIAYRVEYSSDRESWSNYSGNLAVDASTYTTPVLANRSYWWRVKVISQHFSEVSESVYAGGFAPFGKALAFDGSDDRVAMSDSSMFSFSSSDAFSFECWAKVTVQGTYNMLFSKMNNSAPFTGYEIQSRSGGNISVLLSSSYSANIIYVTTTSGTLADNEFHHVAVTYDGSLDASGLKIYFDGAEAPVAVENNSLTGEIKTLAPATIGARSSGAYFFNGQIDEVRLWGDVRTQTEITNKKDTVLLGNESNLLGYYKMDHIGGKSIADKSTNKNHGTWSGTSGGNSSPGWINSEVGVDKTPVLTLTAPNGGETWKVGSTYEITWNSENIPGADLIEIQLSTDGGTNYSIIGDGTFGTYDGKFSWEVSGEITSNSLINIVNTTQNIADVSDQVFSLAPADPALLLTYPNGGQTLTAGRAYTLKWTSANIPATDLIEIRISRDGGQSYTILADGTFGDYAGEYSWTASGAGSTAARIEIANTTQNVSDASDANFTIDSADPVVTVTVPNGGETWTIGETYDITWSTLNIPSTDLIEIRLSTDGGQTYTMLNDGNFGMYGGSYSWTVSGAASTTARVQIANTTQAVTDESDADFTIVEPAATITVIAPNGGEFLTGNQTYTIRWSSENIPDTEPISIQQSINGADYEEIASGTFGEFAGSYEWTVPDVTSSLNRIRIENTNTGLSDISNSNFTIIESPKISVTSPNGGEEWIVGESATITWDFGGFGSGDVIEFSLSIDGGQTFNVWFTGNYQNGTATVSAPDQATASAILKIRNIQKGVEDVSDEPFSIVNVERSIAILSPAGGETFTFGEQVTVDFELQGLVSNDIVDFYLSIDGGSTFPYRLFEAFVSSVSDSSFVWSVSQPATASAVIRARVTTRSLQFVTEAFTINEAPTAPVFNELTAAILGDSYLLNYQLNEAATLFLTILDDGTDVPTATQIKAAATGGEEIPGQLFATSIDYPTANELVSEEGQYAFVRQSIYDLYITAEDEEGNLAEAQTVRNIVAQFTPLENDSIVVDQIYNQMGGENWTGVASDWISLPLSGREEVVIASERISELNFPSKGLTGSLPQSMLSLDSLQVLDLSENSITGLINLSTLPVLQSLNVSNNLLDFGDLEMNASLFTEPADYSPQANLGEADSLTISRGNNYTLSANAGGQSSTYQWYRDLYNTYEESFVAISNSNQSTYSISNLGFDNMGTYYVEVTNETLPGLTISSEPVQVWATANLTINVIGENNQPMNEGAAFALRNRGPAIPFDSIPKKANGDSDPAGLVFTNGTAFFENLILGEYLVSVRGDKERYLPTYYQSTYLWEEANILPFKNNLTQTLRMFVLPPPLTPDDGNGLVSGTIESEFGGPSNRILARKKVKRAACSMRRYVGSGRTSQDDPNWELTAYVESDDEGKFKFEYIPPGLYRFNIEYPGIPMDPDSYVEFEVGADGAANSSIVLEAVVTENGINVKRTNTLGFSDEQLDALKVFPNPTVDQLFVQTGEQFKHFTVQLMSMEGQLIERQDLAAQSTITFNTSGLSEGIYFIHVVNKEDSNQRVTYRVRVKH